MFAAMAEGDFTAAAYWLEKADSFTTDCILSSEVVQ